MKKRRLAIVGVFLILISCFACTFQNLKEEGNFWSAVLSIFENPNKIENIDYLDIKRSGNSTVCRDMLDDEMKTYYDLLDQYVYKLSPYVDQIPLHRDEFQKLIEYYRADHPQAFWLTSGYQYQYNEDSEQVVEATLSFSYQMGGTGTAVRFTALQIESMCRKMEREADKILSEITPEMSEYDKVLYLHDYLIENVEYDETADFQHIAYGALVDKKAVCDGYATAMQYLLTKLGIECRIVYGDDRDGNPQGHAWNIVKVDGNYYHLDVTWDIPPQGVEIPLYSNFLVNTDQILKRHIIFSPLESDPEPTEYAYYAPIPECTATDMSYYQKNDCYVPDLSDGSVKRVLYKANEALANHEENIQFLFENTDDLNQFVEEATDNTDRFVRGFPYSSNQYQTDLITCIEDNVLIFQYTYLE
jgi:transglutaminase-like putative cysteine protease